MLSERMNVMRDLLSYLNAGFWLIMSMLTAAPSDIEVFELTPTVVAVEEFHSVMPAELMEKSGLQLYKDERYCMSELICEGERYYLGEFTGGYGITSGALADMNGDGFFELYYTYSWGSGLHRGMLGSFDAATKLETIYDIAFLNGDLYLRANGDTLEVCEALMLNADSFVEIRAIPGRTLATLSLVDGEVTLTHTTTEHRLEPAS